MVATRDDDMQNRHGQELTVQVWYPSVQPDDDVHLYGGFYDNGVPDGGDIDCTQSHPVVVFSHGNGGIRYQSFSLENISHLTGILLLHPIMLETH